MSKYKPNSDAFFLRSLKAFNLPLRVEYDYHSDSWIILDASGKVLFCSDNGSQAEAIVRFINERDKLKADLKEAKELLGKVLEEGRLAMKGLKKAFSFLNKEKR